MRLFFFIAFFGCLPTPIIKTQVLGNAENKNVEIQFLGNVGKIDELYVCKLVNEKRIECIEYKHFVDELQKL